ncbi:nucleotide exchange factor GrpE [Nitriliruptoraceae bacterium ZYF776]|nr:nucleotide exchange factor GrpE [Profundirhabdus halotolerans]
MSPPPRTTTSSTPRWSTRATTSSRPADTPHGRRGATARPADLHGGHAPTSPSPVRGRGSPSRPRTTHLTARAPPRIDVTDPQRDPAATEDAPVAAPPAGGAPAGASEPAADAGAAADTVDPAADTVDPPADTVDPAADAADEVARAEGLAVVEDPRSREELLAELTEASARRDEYLDDLRRARAEFENFRKRTTREAAGAREAGRADAVSALLEVLDDLDRTLEAADASSDEHLAKGVQLVAEKLVRSLQGQGLARIDEPGARFDPDVHEAVQQVPAEDPVDEPVVAQVLRPGYRLGDRVLRPAMVAVAQ